MLPETKPRVTLRVCKEIICEEIMCLMPAGPQIRRGFKEHDLITCESKVQVVVSLGS